MNRHEYEYEAAVLGLNGVGGELGFLCDSGHLWPFPWLDSKETCDDPTGRNPSMRCRCNFGH